MQVEIDFDVFKALTSLRENENDTYNAVLRRLLKLPNPNTRADATPDIPVQENALRLTEQVTQINALADLVLRGGKAPGHAHVQNALSPYAGAWFDNVFFPNGTQFRATYKGQTFVAAIRNGAWVGTDGLVRTSPSAAASAISNTNVNGWRFWFFKRPGDADWNRLDALKS